MTRILHLSDLHFGRTRADLVQPLLDEIDVLEPDLVVVSGDLTQRARASQFRAARAFLDQMPEPVLVVPGNHDVPLWNLFARLLHPFSRWNRHIGTELEPTWRDDDVIVAGVNTVNPFVWQAGKLSPSTVRRVCDAFDSRPAGHRIVALHHPLDHAPGTKKQPVPGAAHAISELSRCGTDIVLSGHLHAFRAVAHLPTEGGATLLVQAGTGLSTRVRGEPNDFNLLTLHPDAVAIDRYVALDDATRFTVAERPRFRRGAAGWEAVGEG